MELSLEVTIQETEERLVERALKRDRIAFTALYERCVNQIYKHVYYRVDNRSDAEDITEEAFVRAWKFIDKYKRTGALFVAWLMAIAHNLIVDYYKLKKRHVSLKDVVCATGSGSDPEVLAELNLTRDRVREAIMKLKGEKQRVILMHFIDGFSYAEIAQALNKTEGAIRVIQCRALMDLRRVLTE